MAEPAPGNPGPWAASLQAGDGAEAPLQLPQETLQQQIDQQAVNAAPAMAAPVPAVQGQLPANPGQLDLGSLPQSAAMYQAPHASGAAVAQQQYLPYPMSAHDQDAYQAAAMASTQLTPLQMQIGIDPQLGLTPELQVQIQQMQVLAQLQQQQQQQVQAAAAQPQQPHQQPPPAEAAAAAPSPMQSASVAPATGLQPPPPAQQPTQAQPMDASAYAVATPHQQPARPPGEYSYEPQPPKTPVTQEAVENGAAKTCRLCGVAKMLEEFHVNNSNADKHDTRCKACCAQYEKEKRAKKQRILEPTVSEKECRACHETKPAGDFYRYTYSKDGLYQQCKACHAHAGENRLAKLAAGEEAPLLVERKTCSKCNEEKPKSEFYLSKYLSSGLHSQCKRCVRAGQEKRVRCPPDQAAKEKTCRKCRTTKKQEDFYFNNLVEDGLTTYCRACQADKGSPAPGPDGSMPVRSGTRYNVTEPTKSEKLCKKCSLVKPADDFYHIKSSSDGLASNCKACAVQIANSTRKHFVPEPTVEQKVCKTCGENKSANEFYRNRTNADGLFGKCKVCSDSQAEVNRKPRVRHNIQEPTVEEKVCTKCNETKPASEFNRDKTKADGLQFRCKTCVHDYMKRRRRTESTRKLEALEAEQAEQMGQATDSLNVLASLSAQAAGVPGGLQAAGLVAARLGLEPGQQLPPDVADQLRSTAAELAAGQAPQGLTPDMLQQQQQPLPQLSYPLLQPAEQLQQPGTVVQGLAAGLPPQPPQQPIGQGAAVGQLPQQAEQQPQQAEQQQQGQGQQAGAPVYLPPNDDDMNIPVDVNELQHAAGVGS